ncbi:gliding motility lipoprotein GldB [Hanstruepera neustonica]|uniref:Gliding motility lipoprotein GldB n=1 Tax=Hanstruepera neustonica TaxID=1445657 RepID=A0A2K1E1B2_9FLAO|nr:gliding motility lipoprotein GldB [Hanstruepera neustonica]PNQ74072.1 gliding motility lipoprotein GldB [Hanstruepera neustonica]
MRFIIILFSFGMLLSCNQESKVEAEISKIDIDFVVERFDMAMHEAEAKDLPMLKEAYPFMFPDRYDDAFWIARMQDTLQQELITESTKAFDDFIDEEDDITKLFQHLKYYFPEFSTPRVITTTSSVDYRNKVIATDTIVLISIDTYLGKDHEFYQGIQHYLRQNFEREQMVVDMANAYAEKYAFQVNRKTLLDEMVYFGKLLYFKDIMIPFKSDAQKIGYTDEQMEWAKSNEFFIWNHFIDKELLYSTDSKLPSRFINPAPFSKFYLEVIDRESPGRIGQFIGWQIVKSYMANNDVGLKDMMTKEPVEIFNNSKYKPQK